MNKYEVLRLLGSGAQGKVFVVKNKTDGKEYVLKKIECTDESECNKAFNECALLDTLYHPFICPYKEFFVTWDKTISAMCLCVVTELFANGSLAQFLDKVREQKTVIQEELIKKWLGQIIEAFTYLQKKNIVHRDLKPSNIYLTKDDNSICIGDFAVPAVMQDVRTKTRSAVGIMNYMAPEVVNSPYTVQSDTWAIGCILLELGTAYSTDSGTMAGKLIEIKHSHKELRKLLKDVKYAYSTEFTDVISLLLNRSGNIRPAIRDIHENKYIKECLVLSDAVIQDRKARALASSAVRAVPKDRGIEPVVDFIYDNLMSEICVRQGMEYLVTIITADDATLDNIGKKIIAKAMQDFIQEWDIQLTGCVILSNCVLLAKDDDSLFSAEIISRIPVAMKFHNENAGVQVAAMNLLTSIAAKDGIAQLIGDLGGLADIIAAIRQFPEDIEVQAAGCTAIWNLTINEDNVRICTEAMVIVDVVNALENHRDSAGLAEAACACIISLSLEDANMDVLNKRNIIRYLLELLVLHSQDGKLVRNALLALAALVEPEEECAFKVLTNITEDGMEEPGLPYIVDVYDQHKDDPKVVEAVCSVLMELCEYDEIRSEIKYLKIHENVLIEVHRRYKDSKEILYPCEKALVKLGVKIRLHTLPNEQ